MVFLILYALITLMVSLIMLVNTFSLKAIDVFPSEYYQHTNLNHVGSVIISIITIFFLPYIFIMKLIALLFTAGKNKKLKENKYEQRRII